MGDLVLPDVKSKWYEALFRADCRRVMALLREHPRLVRVGWKPDLSQKFEGYAFVRGHTSVNWSEWKGRTALHVGAIRGCAELVKLVLNLIMSVSTEDGHDVAATSSTKSEEVTVEGPGEPNTSKTDITERKSPLVASSSRDDSLAEGEQQKTRSAVAGLAVRFQRVVSNAVRSNRKQKTGLAVTEQHSARLEQELTQETDSESTRRPPPATAAGREEDGNPSTSSEGSVSSKDFPDLLYDDLLHAKDGEYDLSALALATFYGNDELLALLLHAEVKSGKPTIHDELGELLWHAGIKCGKSIVDDELGALLRSGFEHANVSVFDKMIHLKKPDATYMENRARLPEVTRQFIDDNGEDPDISELVENYWDDLDFNFLPREEYLFHYMLTSHKPVCLALWSKVKSQPNKLWRFLLELQDGRGRCPTHVAVDRSLTNSMQELLGGEEPEVITFALTTVDGAGRSPLLRAAATDRWGWVTFILHYSDKYEEISATCHARWNHRMARAFQDCVFNPIQGTKYDPRYRAFQKWQTPVHAAITHGNWFSAQPLIERWHNNGSDMTLQNGGGRSRFQWDPIEFACLVGPGSRGNTDHFAKILQGKELMKVKTYEKLEDCDPDRFGETCTKLKHPWHPLHLVASSGNYEMLNILIQDLQCDPFVEDFEGNNVLHHALKVWDFDFTTCWLDFVDGLDMSTARFYVGGPWMSRTERKKILDDDRIVERKGCIDLLLQAGCDIFKGNKKNEVPYPKNSLNNEKFLTWWYEKQLKEFAANQNNMNFAANAISVTAALVATASYVGPLQPPLGYGGDFNQIQDDNIWVLSFIVFDTLSFYLAIAAITLSLIPSLPMPQQPMRAELQRTREAVTCAVVILFPSILCVFGAFVSSSISVTSANITSSTGGRLTVATASVGGLLCIVTFFVFFIKLLAFSFPKNTWVRYIYNGTTLKSRKKVTEDVEILSDRSSRFFI